MCLCMCWHCLVIIMRVVWLLVVAVSVAADSVAATGGLIRWKPRGKAAATGPTTQPQQGAGLGGRQSTGGQVSGGGGGGSGGGDGGRRGGGGGFRPPSLADQRMQAVKILTRWVPDAAPMHLLPLQASSAKERYSSSCATVCRVSPLSQTAWRCERAFINRAAAARWLVAALVVPRPRIHSGRRLAATTVLLSWAGNTDAFGTTGRAAVAAAEAHFTR